VVNFITALNSNRLTKQMDGRITLVTREFFIRLLKRLRYDVFDVWLHESLKLMKRVTECSGHNQDCRLLGYFSGTKSTPTKRQKGSGSVTYWVTFLSPLPSPETRAVAVRTSVACSASLFSVSQVWGPLLTEKPLMQLLKQKSPYLPSPHSPRAHHSIGTSKTG
jgi:hypothetical protein